MRNDKQARSANQNTTDSEAASIQRTPEAAAMLQQAWSAHQAGHLQEAEGLYQQVLAKSPHDAEALHRLGLLSHQAGRSKEAAELLRRAIRHNPTDANYHGNLALILDALGDFAEAADANRQALALKPAYFGAYFGLANEQRMLGDIEGAIQSYRQALQVQPDHPGVLSNLGSALEALERHTEAIDYFTRASSLAPEHASIHSNLGNALQGAGRFDEAVTSLRRATALDPGYADAHSNLGIALLQSGDVQAAQAAFNDCLKVAPAHRSALAFATIALHESGQHEQAMQLRNLSDYVSCKQHSSVRGFDGIEQFNQALQNHVLSHKTLVYEPFSKSTKLGQQSGNLLQGEKGPVARLEEIIRAEVTTWLDHAPLPANHPYQAHRPPRWSLNVWATVLDNQGYQSPHIHPGGWLSGVYYVTLPDCMSGSDEQGWIEFGALPDELSCSGQHPTRRIQPEAGMLLLFPSFFFHRTIPFESDQQRISIAFDVVPEA